MRGLKEQFGAIGIGLLAILLFKLSVYLPDPFGWRAFFGEVLSKLLFAFGPVALFVWIYLQNGAIASSIQNGTGIPERYRHGYGENAAVFSVKSLKLVGYCALALSVLWIAFMLWLSFGEGNTFLK